MRMLPILLLLAWTCYEDFRYRAVSWWVFPLLLAAAFFYPSTFAEALQYLLTNLCMVTAQLLLLVCYVYIRKKNIHSFFQSFLGLGDVLFWIALCPMLPVEIFMLLLTISFIFALASHGLLRFFSFYESKRHIPLAGLQAVFFGIVLSAGI